MSGKIVREMLAKFRETGSVQIKKRHENSVLIEPVELAVLGQVSMDGPVQ